MSMLSYSQADNTVVVGLSKQQLGNRMQDVAGESLVGLIVLNLKLFLRSKMGLPPEEEEDFFGLGEEGEEPMDSVTQNVIHVILSLIVVSIYYFVWRYRLKKKTTIYASKDTIYIDKKLFSSIFTLRYIAVQKRWRFPLFFARDRLYNVGIVTTHNTYIIAKKYKWGEAIIFATELALFLKSSTKEVKRIRPDDALV